MPGCHSRDLIAKVDQGKYHRKYYASCHKGNLFIIFPADFHNQREQAKCNSDGHQHHQERLGFRNMQKHGDVIEHGCLEKSHGKTAEQIANSENNKILIMKYQRKRFKQRLFWLVAATHIVLLVESIGAEQQADQTDHRKDSKYKTPCPQRRKPGIF